MQLGREFGLWVDRYYTQCSIKGGLPMEPEARAWWRCWWEKSVRAVQILSLGWDLQQLAMEKKTQREWSSTDPYPRSSGPCPQTQTQRVSHRKTEDTRTHWSTDTHSCPQNLTSRSRHKQPLRWRPWLPIKALSQRDTSRVSAERLPCDGFT